MTEKLLELIQAKHPTKELDVGDMKTLKANGMTFKIQAYHAEGLGHISVMRAKGFFGLMKMDTLIINPKDIDLPIYSYDRIYAMGNDTLIVELYNTLSRELKLDRLDAVKDRYADLPARDPGAHWYDSIKLSQSISKKGKRAQSSSFDQLTLEHLSAYLESGETHDIDTNEKQRKASYYVNGLLTNGGPSTDVFKKALGVEKTTELFRSVLFDTAQE